MLLRFGQDFVSWLARFLVAAYFIWLAPSEGSEYLLW